MPKIEIYTKDVCPYCVRAKTLLQAKGAAYTEYNISKDDAAREQMLIRSNGARTVPQIFIDGQHIGGSDDLYALNDRGELDSILKAAS
ncbi:MAG: glutaredoxin 3 [Alphaproteobacteria bacterium]|nr:glutaredoxin 3 [Alphaproteobacteria bacterium]